MVGLRGPACRFVYPDVIKSYFIENVPCSLHICTCRQEAGCGRLWSQQVQVPSRLFQKPASRRPLLLLLERRRGSTVRQCLTYENNRTFKKSCTVFQKIPYCSLLSPLFSNVGHLCMVCSILLFLFITEK